MHTLLIHYCNLCKTQVYVTREYKCEKCGTDDVEIYDPSRHDNFGNFRMKFASGCGKKNAIDNLFLRREDGCSFSPTSLRYLKKSFKTRQPTNTYANKQKIKKIVVNCNSSCSICFEECLKGDVGVILKCGHVYHENCIMEWVKIKTTCPCCRKIVL